MHLSRRLFVHPISQSDHYFIFNPLSGSVDLADTSEVMQLERVMQTGLVDDVDQGVIDHLVDQKMLFESASEEEDYLEDAVRFAREQLSSQPSVYVVCPTLTCNLDCGYCFEGPTSQKPKGVMTNEEVDDVFKAIQNLENKRAESSATKPPAPWISLFGGEPLQASTFKCLEYILERAYHKGYPCTFTSNGLSVKAFKKVLERFAPNGVTPIIAAFQITVDGPKDVHDKRRPRLGGQGSFDANVDGIDILLANDVHVTLRVNLDQGNIYSLPELCEFVKAKKWDEHERFEIAVAPVVLHTPDAGGGTYKGVIDELTIERQVLELVAENPIVAELCSLKHLRCLDHLTAQLDRSDRRVESGDPSHRTGPRYWYCEQGTNANWVFTPDGYVYTCTEAVGKPRHAIGRFSPELDIWKAQASDWIGRTILSNPQCRTCKISTLCGGGCHFAAREKASGGSLLQISLSRGNDRKTGSLLDRPALLKDVHPYCANAEGVVRAYFDTVGQKILAAHGLG